MSNPSAFSRLHIHYHTGSLPPPYSHEITAEITARPTGYGISFAINYLDRDDLTEDDLYMEGFTPDDGFAWEGALPDVWVNYLQQSLDVSTFPRDQQEAAQAEPIITLKYQSDASEKQVAGIVAENGYWEYLLQELMQSIYELAGLERPLEVVYREVSKQDPPLEVALNASFAAREAQVKISREESAPIEKTIPWKEIKEGMKRIYQYEFDEQRAKPKVPMKRGSYLYLGEGGWLPIPQGLLPAQGNTQPRAEHIQEWFRQFAD